MLPLHGAVVRSLVGELRSHVPCVVCHPPKKTQPNLNVESTSLRLLPESLWLGCPPHCLTVS